SIADEAVSAIPDCNDDEYDVRWEVALADAAARLMTDAHRRRLRLLVRRVEAQVPFHGFPAASTTVERACAAFDQDKPLRGRGERGAVARTRRSCAGAVRRRAGMLRGQGER